MPVNRGSTYSSPSSDPLMGKPRHAFFLKNPDDNCRHGRACSRHARVYRRGFHKTVWARFGPSLTPRYL